MLPPTHREKTGREREREREKAHGIAKEVGGGSWCAEETIDDRREGRGEKYGDISLKNSRVSKVVLQDDPRVV